MKRYSSFDGCHWALVRQKRSGTQPQPASLLDLLLSGCWRWGCVQIQPTSEVLRLRPSIPVGSAGTVTRNVLVVLMFFSPF